VVGLRWRKPADPMGSVTTAPRGQLSESRFLAGLVGPLFFGICLPQWKVQIRVYPVSRFPVAFLCRYQASQVLSRPTPALKVGTYITILKYFLANTRARPSGYLLCRWGMASSP
jgi:hypothetical protein